MKLLLLPVFMFLVAVAQVFCEEPREEADYWTSSNQIQDDWFPKDSFREILQRMTRKPRPHQFIGLMGKRSMGNTQIAHKKSKMWKHWTAALIPQGHKVNSFVGLMGKRSQEEPESYEWSTLQTYNRRR